MYTLLLVDDEEDVIEVIERKVSWEQIGFHVVGHAGNGFKALEIDGGHAAGCCDD